MYSILPCKRYNFIKSLTLFCLITLTQVTNSAVYQWSVPLEGKDKDARAFLWIPPNCKQVRGLIFASQVILEDKFCADAHIREACTKESLGIVLVFRGPLTQLNYKDGGDKPFFKILSDLADVSGYSEINMVPVLTVGHSGGSNGAWALAYAHPNRVFGILTLHAAALVNPPDYDPKARVEGIPAFCVSGEYESWGSKLEPLDRHWRWLRGNILDMRGRYNHILATEIVQPGAGHFNFDDHLAILSAMFIQKAAHYRIPAHTNLGDSVKLNTLDETKGWLTDIRVLSDDKFPPTAFKDYKGDPSLAFWQLDEEMAKAVDAFPRLYGGKMEQRVCFVQDGKPVPAAWINELAFEPADDGLTIGMKGSFLTETPGIVADGGIPLSHSNTGKIKFSLIGGWGGGGEQISPDSFRIKFSQFGPLRYCANIQIMAYHEGNANYKYAEQAGQVKFPDKIKEGLAQVITFPEIPKLSSSSTSVPLQATSSANLPVYYTIKEGPATIKNNNLMLDAIPPRSKFPVKITVIAWQLGKMTNPMIQTAVPIEQTIFINN